MFTKVSVLVPSRGRVERLRTLIASFQATCSPVEAELVFRIDDDDPTTLEYLDDQSYSRFVGPRLSGYESLPVFFNQLVDVAQGDVLICGNDDMVFRSVGWAPALLEVANHFPDGLFDLGVTTHNETHFPFSTVSRMAVKKLGFIWDPRIFWGDIFLRDVMANFDRCVMVPSVAIDHDWAGNDPDETFVAGNGERFKSRGSDYWEHVHAPAVRDAIERLRSLQ